MATKKSLPQNPETLRKKKLPAGVVERKGRWFVRVRYRVGTKRRVTWRECAKNPTDAKEVRQKIKAEIAQHGTKALQHSRETFGSLADYYEAEYLIEAQYVDGRKTAGRRGLKNPKSQLKRLRELVGDSTRLRHIDYEFLRKARIALFNTPTRKTEKEPRGHQRSAVDVNRHFQLLRHMFRVALRKRWILQNPFTEEKQEPLITPADEKPRHRVMSFDEEAALLAQCVAPREHLRLLIIGLTDTLMRSESEFYKLRVRDLDLDERRVNVQQLNTKTLRARGAPMSKRFADEVRAWIAAKQLGPADRLFPYDSVKRSWATLKQAAGVSDLRIKDLRRTAATRLYRAGYPIAEISRLLGHTTIEMTYEYIGVDRDTTGRANELLDAMHAEREQATDFVN